MWPPVPCGETREIPFLEGTVPPEPDNVHTEGCFDIVQEIRQDDRRPQEWIDSAALWADRLVNGNTGSVGDPTELKENPNYRLAIAPVLGNSGYGQPICGELRATPKPRRRRSRPVALARATLGRATHAVATRTSARRCRRCRSKQGGAGRWRRQPTWR